MKIKTFTLLSFFLLWGGSLVAQLDIKTDPTSLIFNSADFGLELIIADKVGVEAGGGFKYGKKGWPGLRFNRSGYRAYGIVKYYFDTRLGGDGLSLGLYVKKKDVSYTEINDTDAYNDSFNWDGLAMGMIMGYKYIWDSGFILSGDIGVGGAFYNRLSFTEEEDDIDVSFVPILAVDMLARLTVGYRFGKK